jgi:hypothetical protein
MEFNREDGLYVFEVVLGYRVNGEEEFTMPYLIQANDPDEAEDKVMDCLENRGVSEEFWIEELSDPYSVEEYQHMREEDGDQAFIKLDDLTTEDFRDILSY